MDEEGFEEKVERTVNKMGEVTDNEDPTVLCFEEHKYEPVIAKVEGEYKYLSRNLLYPAYTDEEEIKELFFYIGDAKVTNLSEFSHRFDADMFMEDIDE